MHHARQHRDQWGGERPKRLLSCDLWEMWLDAKGALKRLQEHGCKNLVPIGREEGWPFPALRVFSLLARNSFKTQPDKEVKPSLPLPPDPSGTQVLLSLGRFTPVANFEQSQNNGRFATVYSAPVKATHTRQNIYLGVIKN